MANKIIYDTIIIGGGPAGAAAAVYAGRKKLNTLLLTDNFGGQSIVSDNIENWIGIPKISGIELARAMEKHVREYQKITIKIGKRVDQINGSANNFVVKTNQNNIYWTKTLVVASGGRRRRLEIPGEDIFDGKGVAYCSTCDAPLFRNRDVAVVGGGNSGLEAVIDLLPYAKKIYLLNRKEELKGDPATQEQIKKEEKVNIINNAKPLEIKGEKVVKILKYLDTLSNQEQEITINGVFVEIGSIPNSEFLGNLVKLNKFGEIIVDHQTGVTSNEAIFAAGDVTDDLYKQNNIAAGDGVRAALSAYNYLLKINKKSPAEN